MSTKLINSFTWRLTLIAVFFCAMAVCVSGTSPKQTGHTCRWDLCPYKGVPERDNREAVIAYTEEDGTDAYCIDMLHLQYPDKDYDQLEDLLFSSTN